MSRHPFGSGFFVCCTIGALRKIACINGLRGICIIAVLIRHIFVHTADPTIGILHLHGVLPSPILAYPLATLMNSQEAVFFFFTLSGFVLTLPFYEGRRTLKDVHDLLKYYFRRALRLLPLLAIVLITAALVRYRPDSLEDFLARLRLDAQLTFFFPHLYVLPPDDPPLWSLRSELWFSLLLPLLYALMRRRGAAIGITALFALYVSVKWWSVTMKVPPELWFWHNGLPPQLYDFALGLVVARLFADRTEVHRFVLPVSALMLYAGTVASQFALTQQEIFLFAPAHIATTTGFALVTCALLNGKRTIAHRWLEWRPLQMMGLMCYSIYAWHVVFVDLFHARDDAWHAFWYFLFLLPFCFLSYRYLEFPHIKHWRLLLPQRWSPATAFPSPELANAPARPSGKAGFF
jgi:peptidoglycan/LPS O-acetylase OafA/YrhL